MNDFNQILNWCQTFTPDPEQRKSWYGSVTKTYDRVRPKYSRVFLDRVVKVARIPVSAKILEIGCGPGTATIELAKMGYSIVALEPSAEACNLARQNVNEYPNVKIINSSFEEWEAEDWKFDAILAATAWHWVAPASKHQKVASLLKDNGALILLWNTGMKPPLQVFESLTDLFTRYIPVLANYKDSETELNELRIFADAAINSGLFSAVCEEFQENDVNYSIDDYLLLLTTYSPCIALSPAHRHELLTQLRDILVQNWGEQIPLSYLSIFHIVRKISP